MKAGLRGEKPAKGRHGFDTVTAFVEMNFHIYVGN
jgi:hypothetical protein